MWDAKNAVAAALNVCMHADKMCDIVCLGGHARDVRYMGKHTCSMDLATRSTTYSTCSGSRLHPLGSFSCSCLAMTSPLTPSASLQRLLNVWQWWLRIGWGVWGSERASLASAEKMHAWQKWKVCVAGMKWSSVKHMGTWEMFEDRCSIRCANAWTAV